MDIGTFIRELQNIQRAHGDDLRIGVILDIDDYDNLILEDAIPVVLDGHNRAKRRQNPGPTGVIIVPVSQINEVQ